MSTLQEVFRERGLAAIAKACDVTPQAVHKWLSNGVPAERVLELERITGISRHELRPDIYPDEPAPLIKAQPREQRRRAQ